MDFLRCFCGGFCLLRSCISRRCFNTLCFSGGLCCSLAVAVGFLLTWYSHSASYQIRRIIRDCNDEQFLHSDEPDVLLPHFSCHSLRHTFTTRMCEAGVNIKVIQDALGHSDISTTLNIYADVTKEMKAAEFKGLDSYFVV